MRIERQTNIEGKTIAKAEWLEADAGERLSLTFTDGSTAKITSWDCEDYQSGLNFEAADA